MKASSTPGSPPRLGIRLLLAMGCGLLLCACASSRVDPISPDIHGVSITSTSSVVRERYYYERLDPQTEQWYEARELVPGFGLMVYTRDGEYALRKELEKDIK